MYFYTEMVL